MRPFFVPEQVDEFQACEGETRAGVGLPTKRTGCTGGRTSNFGGLGQAPGVVAAFGPACPVSDVVAGQRRRRAVRRFIGTTGSSLAWPAEFFTFGSPVELIAPGRFSAPRRSGRAGSNKRSARGLRLHQLSVSGRAVAHLRAIGARVRAMQCRRAQSISPKSPWCCPRA